MVHKGFLPLHYIHVGSYESMLCLSSLVVEVAVSSGENVVVAATRGALEYRIDTLCHLVIVNQGIGSNYSEFFRHTQHAICYGVHPPDNSLLILCGVPCLIRAVASTDCVVRLVFRAPVEFGVARDKSSSAALLALRERESAELQKDHKGLPLGEAVCGVPDAVVVGGNTEVLRHLGKSAKHHSVEFLKNRTKQID